jgi:hypothetical protein
MNILAGKVGYSVEELFTEIAPVSEIGAEAIGLVLPKDEALRGPQLVIGTEARTAAVETAAGFLTMHSRSPPPAARRARLRNSRRAAQALAAAL